MDPYTPILTFVLGAASGWLSRRWWFRFEKRMALRAHLSGWLSEIQNINPNRDDARSRIWLAYRSGVPDLQRLACLGDFRGLASDTIYRLSHIQAEEMDAYQGDKRDLFCSAISETLKAAK